MSAAEGDVIPIEQRAKEMGWAPKEEWRGDPERWIDAEQFVHRGEEILPILRSTNRKLQDEVAALKNEVSATKTALQNSATAIEELKKFNSEANREKMKESKAALISQLKKAREDGNLDAEVELGDQLDSVRAAERDAAKPPAKTNGAEEPKTPQVDPDYPAWASDNPWFQKDNRKTALFMAIAAELRQDPANDSLKGRKFYDKATTELEKTLGGPAPRRQPKVEGASQSGGDGGTKKSFADLPADAKVACDKTGERLIGPKSKGFAYESVAQWRDAYTTKYFEGE
jgi:hypothetical protein